MRTPLYAGAVVVLACLTHLPAAELYVDLNSPGPTPPYADWSTAATTIQDAVDAASAGDTIWVTNGVYQTGGRPASGEVLTNRVLVTNAVTLQSVNGPEVTIIAGYQVPTTRMGDAAVRCAHLADGTTLNGFTLANGATRQIQTLTLSNEGHGGGVWCQTTNVTLANCVIVSNICSFYGGGVYSGTLRGCQVQYNGTWSGSLGGGGGLAYSVVSDSIIRSNSANGGPSTAPGGVLNCVVSNGVIQGNLQAGASYSLLYNCALLNNSNAFSGGGAIQCLLNNCTVSNNYSGQDGGGLYNCSLNNTVVSSNQALWGGGLYCDMPTNTLGQSNLVSGNTAHYFGGGIVLSGSSVHTTSNLLAWTVVSNTAAGDGGGLYLAALGSLRLDGSTFTGNYAGGNGGGFSSPLGISVLSNAAFTGNLTAGSGGGAYNAGLVTCVLTGNQATNGGGAFGSATNCAFTGNIASANGGGLFCTRPVVVSCSFTNNSAHYGGGVYGGILANSTLWGNVALTNGGGVYNAALSNCLVAGNQAISGGGIFQASGGANYPGTSFTCLNSTIEGNSASKDGGGIYFSSLVTGTNCLLANNSAGNNGGGSVGGVFSRSQFVGNTAGASGGGAYNVQLSTSGVSNNTATVSGGGVYGANASLSILANNVTGGNGGGACNSSLSTCLVSGNSAVLGGGVYVTMLTTSTLVKNQASSAGGGAYFLSGGNVTGCILYGNNAPSGPNSGGSAVFNHTCTTPMPPGGTGNLAIDPGFIDLAGGNYRLQTNSPCINTGSGSATSDLDGRPRVVGGRIDMGAYEFQGAGMGEFIAWLQQHGLPTGGSADYVDSDRDGLNNWQEWVAGTDPTNASSVLSLLTPVVPAAGSSTLVTWQSVSNRSYFLQRSGDLLAPTSFSTIQSNIAGQFGTTSFLDTNAPGASPVFYRVGVQ